MTKGRIVAVGLIFVLACGGWATLGYATARRSMEFSGRLGSQVEKLWGEPLCQTAPAVGVEIPGSKQARTLLPTQNVIRVRIEADHRRKGLIWYPTYTCHFDGCYTIANDSQVAQKARVHFSFPAADGTYDAFAIAIDGQKRLSTVDTQQGIAELIELGPGRSAEFHVTYRTRGIGEWRYRMDPKAGRVRGLDLEVTTNFRNVDYPAGCLSPMSATETPDGALLQWQASDLISKEEIGVTIPEKLNPGPLTSRITFFAPACLVFFFVLAGAIAILYGIGIHPMHYLFVAAGFFAFHLLLAYMAGLVNIHVAFLVAATVSVGLVTSYLTAALRGAFPWKVAMAGQIFFLVIFSYSFFLEGVTGLTIAICSVVTLAVLMKVTAHVDWNTVFAPHGGTYQRRPPLPPAPQPTTRDA